MQPMDEAQEQILNELKQKGIPHSFRCANCGAWQGEPHKPECPAPKPVVVPLPKDVQ